MNDQLGRIHFHVTSGFYGLDMDHKHRLTWALARRLDT